MGTFRSLTIQSGVTTQVKDTDDLLVGTGISSNTGTLTLNAAGSGVLLASGKNFTAVGGASALDFSAASGIFKTSTGAVTIGNGAVGITGAATFSAAGTALTVDNNSLFTGTSTHTGAIYANGNIDRSSAGTLVVGGTNATALTLGHSGMTTTVAGDLSVTGNETIMGFSTFTSGVTFDGYVVVGDGSGVDTLSFNATSGRLGSASSPDVLWTKEMDHSFYVDASTTALVDGGALTIKAGNAGAGGNGGNLNLDSGTGGGTGSFVNIGTTNAQNIFMGASGVVTAVTGGLSQSTGAVTLSANGASSLTTSSGALTLTAAGTSTWSTSSGALTVDSAAALNLGSSAATSIAMGHSGITTTVTGGLTQLTGAVSLSGNAASSLTTSAGALTLTSAAATTWSTGAGALTLNGAGGMNIQTAGATRLAVADAALTVQAGVTLATTGSGNINLPNNGSARFKIEGTAVGSTVTAPNLDTLTNGGDATALHTHTGLVASTAHSTVLTGMVTTAIDGYYFGYVSSDNTFTKAIATSFDAANVVGVSEVANTVTVAGHCEAIFDSAPTAGQVAYLSAATAGQLTTTAPSTVGQFVTRVGIVLSGTAVSGRYPVSLCVMAPLAL